MRLMYTIKFLATISKVWRVVIYFPYDLVVKIRLVLPTGNNMDLILYAVSVIPHLR